MTFTQSLSIIFLIDQPIQFKDVIILKCRSRRSISIICILLLLIAVLSLSACGQDTAPADSNPNVENTPQYTSTVAKDTTPNIVGEWSIQDEYSYTSFIFYSDTSMELIIVDLSDCVLLDQSYSGFYSVSDNLITATYNTKSDGISRTIDFTYDPDNHTLSANNDIFTCVTVNVDDPLTIVGTWELLSDSAAFPFHFNDCFYSGANNITFYHDGSYSINFDDSIHSGTYSTVHDGAAIQIDDNKIYTSPEIMKCNLLSESILLIEADPEWQPGIYYAMKRIG